MQHETRMASGTIRRPGRKTLLLMRRNYIFYLFLLPACLYIGLFCYGPMYGIQLAFKDYVPSLGVWGSKWVGLRWFESFFKSPRAVQIIGNTLIISFYTLIAGFPVPILLALIFNNIQRPGLKRVSQTITYMPHFISTVVLVGMMSAFFSPRSGFVNTVIAALGGPSGTYFMGSPQYFRHLYVWSGVWQSAGWGSIIYMAALAGVSPELHEAAVIDGATKLQRVLHIDIPAIMPTMVILLILSCGNIMNVGFEKVFLMKNPLNQQVAEVISTYTYTMGLTRFEYSYSTAIGLFNNVINFIVLLSVNKIAGKVFETSLW